MGKVLRSTLITVLAVVVLAWAPGHAEQQSQSQAPPPATPPAPPAQDQPPIFRAGINFVRVDVIALDRQGNAVLDLKPEDFQVSEGGTAQKVETFKLISLDGGLMQGPDGPPRQIRTDIDEETEASRDDVRLFAIFMDDYHVRRETSMSAREQIARFVETQLGPSDMVGLMRPLQPVDTVRMTRNHGAIQAGIRQFLGRKYDYTPTNEMEERYVYYPTEVVEGIRRQVSMGAIKSLITRMGGLKEGRKALILVSEGYTALLPPQMRDSMAAFPGSGNPAAGDPNAGTNSPLEDRANFSASTMLEDELREIYGTANRNNVAIYAVDPRGLATNEFGMDMNIGSRTDRQQLNSTIDTLRTLSLETDGRAIINRNDLTAGMKQIVRDTSAYYLLGYNSTFTATDGKFHEIKVQVKRPGVQVRARKGYWAYSVEDAKRATAPPTPPLPTAYATALSSLTQPSRVRPIRTWVGSEQGSDGKTRVTLVWERMPPTPGERARPEDAPARIGLIAAGMDGTPYFRGRTADAAAATAATTGGASLTFEARPGPMQLRLSVENASNDVIDSEVREVVVPDLTLPQTTIATPEVFRARTVRDFQQLKTNAQATPTAVREFTRTDRVFLRITAYAPGGQKPVVTAQLLNRTGQPMSALAPTPSPASPDSTDFDLTLAPMAAGEYLIEITATGPGAPAKEVVGIRIAG